MYDKHYLTPLFEPRSVAVIGATERAGAVASIVLTNLLAAKYRGHLFAVNPHHATVHGVPCFPSLEAVPQRVELAVVATPAETVPQVIEDAGRAGVRAAVIISAGFGETGLVGSSQEKALLANAQHHGVRLIGPNCIGIMRPEIGLNATFAKGGAQAGSLALVSQSGALCTAILDWAEPNGIGFSSVISLGSAVDVDFGEILDYLVADSKTEHILLYVEGVRNARAFMSALRATSRVKPVFVLKVGRHAAVSRAVQSHSGALVGTDDVFDAALRRAGVVRVATIGQLFAAAAGLTARIAPRGNRLAIITNGGGPGAMGADRAADLAIQLAELSQPTLEALNAALPTHWSHGNPVDIIGDADQARYRAALAACLADPAIDGVLVMCVPQAISDPLDAARAVVEASKGADKPIIACWMGETQVAESRKLFQAAGIPHFRTPEPAVELFSHLSAYYRNRQLLLQTPGPRAVESPSDVEAARLIIDGVLAEDRDLLNEMESKAVLAAFRIPIARTVVARSAREAMLLAEELGLPVALKIVSPEITHKSDVGGVRLNLRTLAAVRAAYQDLIDNVRAARPGATIDGIAVEPMVERPNGRELMIGVAQDQVFGPVITFGAGGTAVEVLRDRAVALAPLNELLIRDMVRSTRVAILLGRFRNLPPIAMAELETTLLRVSEMVCELPQLRELDINPLIVDEAGAIAVDARIVVGRPYPGLDRYGHMAIHPYPAHRVHEWQMSDGTAVTMRPIRPEDAEIEQEFVKGLSPESKYFRFMNTLRELTPQMLARFTQIDYDREMAFIAVTSSRGKEVEIGVCRYVTNPDGESCEFAVVVADEWQGRGIAVRLMEELIAVAREKRLKRMLGHILASNSRMLKLVVELGFTIGPEANDPMVRRAVLALQQR